MEKLEILLENHRDIVMEFIDNLYNQKYPKVKKSKTICHFKSLGNTYNSDIFVRNYIDFMNHVSMLVSYSDLKLYLPNYISKGKSDFSETCNNKNQAVKLKSGMYLKTYSPTSIKMDHIKKICSELLNCELNFIK
jgi:hypothetical protein